MPQAPLPPPPPEVAPAPKPATGYIRAGVLSRSLPQASVPTSSATASFRAVSLMMPKSGNG